MKRDPFRLGLGLLTLAVILAAAVAFTVREEHTALVTRFGELVRTVDEPGLHWKLPWPLERTQSVDRRVRVLETRHGEMLTRDKKNVVLKSFALWRVVDPARFARAVGDAESAEDKLDGLVTDAKIGVLGRYDLSALVSTDPELLRAEQVERDVLASVPSTAAERYGIEVLDDEVGGHPR